MINKHEVKEFFDSLASTWDNNMIKDDDIIYTILSNANVKRDCDVLDVACGTGVLIPYYKSLNAKSITGIDISPNMIQIAKNKFENDYCHFICSDVETYTFDKKFDSIVVYNAFPHFADPESLVRCLSHLLKENGTLSIAHGMSREKINMHHSTVMQVSNTLLDANELAQIFKKYLKVTCIISNEKMYQVCGMLSK